MKQTKKNCSFRIQFRLVLTGKDAARAGKWIARLLVLGAVALKAWIQIK